MEEVVVNAFYHRDYLSYQSIMIEIEPELIRIISFPGIDRSIPQRVIEEGERFSSRYYRNKRLGEFLRELDLSEGKSTGIPTIQEELRKNGSPKAMFFTDEDRRAITVEIPIHPDFLEKKVAIEGEKVAIEGEKVAIEFLKQRIDIMKVNANTKRKIRILLEEMQTERIFGRTEIAACFKISVTSAGNLITKMKEADLIEEVSGFGKGKYKFVQY